MAVVDEPSIEMVQRGVAGVMKHLGMRADGPAPVSKPVLLERAEVVRAGDDGHVLRRGREGRNREKGARLGRITDFHGKTIEEIFAPFDGHILYVIGTPPITKGEPVAAVGATGAR